jgi:FkbM family methyltransferase
MSNEIKTLQTAIQVPLNCNFRPDEWSEGFTPAMRLAELWVRHVPRGKGWFPRWVGRHLCANDKAFVRTVSGMKLAVEPGNLDVYTYISSQGGSWDDHVVHACQSLISGEGVFYDIGASVGYISIEMAAGLRRGRVIAFEPQPALAENVARSAMLNGFDHLEVLQVMLGDKCGDSSLYVGSHSIHASAMAREPGSQRLQCNMTTLDALVASGAIPPPNAIKIDVEGAEMLAFSGARETISKHRPHIIFESDENMDRYGYKRSDILGLLGSLCPYDFFFVTAGKARIPVTEENMESRLHADVLAVPRV